MMTIDDVIDEMIKNVMKRCEPTKLNILNVGSSLPTVPIHTVLQKETGTSNLFKAYQLSRGCDFSCTNKHVKPESKTKVSPPK